jgi:hypothetical protein
MIDIMYYTLSYVSGVVLLLKTLILYIYHSVDVVLKLHCSYLSGCVACSELLNHFLLWQTTVSTLQVCAVLAQSYNTPARMSR